ncbi:hypothetical protein B0G76_3200 [Paraburkholderia sp. BL23I1N1]|uniref:hypothetical protein n=1 Tax=Paraburkholderia sp. BL23I1N1 TaxID=1938802 RepID=UPI000FED7981|nr:hypothetical protein [Paraburkholderia sp. BL23I1N1]RKE36975.1 hypothetical protein B0G76_3200 [Paraburkholderia sp. BL23I1N1]
MKKLAFSDIRYWIASFILGLMAISAPIVRATEPAQALDFETHAAFFSKETKQKTALDPQVFVKESSAVAAVGPQGIRHVAGLRNALVSDDASLPLFNAEGRSLNMSLGQWLAPKGQAVLSPLPTGAERITVAFSRLKPGGHYSLFENHFDQKPVGFTPLDAKGTENSFVADSNGRGVATVIAPSALTHDNAVLLVYHSDNMAHGKSRGDIGVNAHHQLIARPK